MGLRGPGAKPVKRRGGRKRIATGTRAEEVIRFVESLPITSGKFAGQNFKVRPWQRTIIEAIYRTNESGHRVVRQALLTMPRKNGKTGLTAALALAHLCGPEAEARGQIYSAAAERNQASLIFNEMKAIVQAVPKLRNRVIVRDFNKHLEDIETGSFFMSLSADAKTKHGFSASCIIYDELAQAPDRNLYDVLMTSTGAREEPLAIVISTQSGDPNHIMSELVDYGLQVRDGIVEDESFYPCIYTAPEEADPWDEATWFACNPALDDFRSLEEMRNAANQAQRMPAREATFRLLYLNQRVAEEKRFVARMDWDACGSDIKPEDLVGQACYGGLDLSGKNALTALVLTFPQPDGKKPTLSYFWTPREGLEEAEGRDKAPYRLWVKQGHLLTTPGRIIDYRAVALEIAELNKLYDIQMMAFDPWKIDQLVKELDEIGLDFKDKMVPIGQSFKDMDAAVQALEDDILANVIRHNKNPVQTWCIDNVRVAMDAAGFRKFDKRKATGRIDGAVAMGLSDLACSVLDEGSISYAGLRSVG
jgi:phage terminase large subunit-like protein